MQVPVNVPYLSGNEKKYVMDCLDTGWISSEGAYIKKFEEAMAAIAGRRYAVAVSNGSVALDAAVEALSLPPGSEIIVPSFTIISCGAAVVRAGLTPKFVDCDKDTFNMTLDHVKKAFTPKTKAIMLVHLYGLPVDLGPILEFAKEKGLKVIEDSAQMHGQTYKGKPCGSFGDVSTFSFYPNKHITTGEGGMIVTDDKEIYEKCQSLRNLCFVPERRFLHYELGHNFRMTNLQAAIGLAQTEKIDHHIEKKRAIGAYYSERFVNLKKVTLPVATKDYAKNIYWVFPLVLKPEAGMKAEAAMKLLADRGVGVRPFFYPMHSQPVFLKQHLGGESCPNAEYIGEYGFYIPSGIGTTPEQLKYVADVVVELFG